jgi:hypothetical protein
MKGLLTTAHIQSFMHNLSYGETTEKNREVVIMTGQGGLEMFNLAIEKANSRDYAEYLHQSGHVKYEEKERILSMIDSEDKENYEIAKLLLKNIKLKHPY